MRGPIAILVIGVLLVACGPAGQSPRVSGDKLYEAIGGSILVVDSRNHAVERRLPLGAPSPDWKHLYSMLGDSLADTNPLTGTTQDTVLVGAQYELPLATDHGLPGGLSPAGRWLVLQSFDGSATHMLVIDTRSFKIADRFSLAGGFNFDAISDDGVRLYLIQNLNRKQYHVRLFNTALNQLDPTIVVDKSDGGAAMTGIRLSGIAAPDGSMLFSIYVRENESPFIHALDLGGPFAFCLDLPGSGYARWALAMRRDGSRLYAISATGAVAELDTSNSVSPQVVRTVRIPAGAEAAALSADGATLVAAGGSGLAWVDVRDLRLRMSMLNGWHVSAVGLSPDGKRVYAIGEQGRVAEISMETATVAAEFDPGAGLPTALMRVASS